MKTLHAAATSVAALQLLDVPVLRCELLDAASVRAFNRDNSSRQAAKDVAETGVVGPCFGRAGYGNLHRILPVRADDEATGYFDRLRGVQERPMQRTLDAQGTVTGEHGVGHGKIPLP